MSSCIPSTRSQKYTDIYMARLCCGVGLVAIYYPATQYGNLFLDATRQFNWCMVFLRMWQIMWGSNSESRAHRLVCTLQNGR